MHRNQYINLCPNQCNLDKISICCQWMCFEELKCSLVSSSTSFHRVQNQSLAKSIFLAKYFVKKFINSYFLFLGPQIGLKESFFGISFKQSPKQMTRMSNTQYMSLLVGKKGVSTHICRIKWSSIYNVFDTAPMMCSSSHSSSTQCSAVRYT